MTEPADTVKGFDFQKFKIQAIEKYQKSRPLHEKYAEVIRKILSEAFNTQKIKIHSIEARAKDIESFSKKVITPSFGDLNKPRYPNPLSDITDLTGVRVIVFFPRTLEVADIIIKEQFDVIKILDKNKELHEGGKFGYGSIHYLIRLKKNRVDLTEYRKFNALIAEVQIRTILQHAWAEIEHDIQYKADKTTPETIRRRFMSLAGILELADREFQAIQDEDERLRSETRRFVQRGELEKVEITSDALRTYLNKKLGADGRISHIMYEIEAEILHELGFVDLQEVERCIDGYNDNELSKLLWGKRQGQLVRFENLLLAGMGDNFIKYNSFKDSEAFVANCRRNLKILENKNVIVGSYLPKGKM